MFIFSEFIDSPNSELHALKDGKFSVGKMDSIRPGSKIAQCVPILVTVKETGLLGVMYMAVV